MQKISAPVKVADLGALDGAALLDSEVVAKLPELKSIARSVFSCDPEVAVETDPEIPDDHYLVLHITLSADVETVIKLQDRWYKATAALLGDSANKVHLMLSVE